MKRSRYNQIYRESIKHDLHFAGFKTLEMDHVDSGLNKEGVTKFLKLVLHIDQCFEVFFVKHC